MDKFMPLFRAFVDFLLKLLGNLGVFSDNEKLPGVINQYIEDGKTVIDAARG